MTIPPDVWEPLQRRLQTWTTVARAAQTGCMVVMAGGVASVWGLYPNALGRLIPPLFVGCAFSGMFAIWRGNKAVADMREAFKRHTGIDPELLP